MANLTPGTAEWWMDRLTSELKNRMPVVELLDRYYDGDHPLPEAPEAARRKYHYLLKQSRSNWMALVVDAVAERLRVTGFRAHQETDDGMTADREAWDRWQANGLDALQELVHTEALKQGQGYVLVDPYSHPAGAGDVPLITPESTKQVVCGYDPARPSEPAAALKLWRDPGGRWRATLYLPDEVWRLESTTDGRSGRWPTLQSWDTRSDVDANPENPLGQVPVVEFRNRPRLTTAGILGVSEISDVIDIQDRINTSIFGRLLATWFAAYRQRWATGLTIERDDEGNPIQPFDAGVDRLWTTELDGARFGEFSESDLSGYIKSVEADIQHLAAITRTPPHYLLGQSGAFPSGESLKATETGLVAKVRRRQQHFGEAWERVDRLAAAAQDRPASMRSEVVWADPESRTEGELVDSLVKMATLGVPMQVLWERWGASPQQQEDWMRQLRRETLNRQGLDLAGLGADPTDGGPIEVG